MNNQSLKIVKIGTAIVFILIGSVLFWWLSIPSIEFPPEVATVERSALSSSGDYELQVVELLEQGSFYQFQIIDTQNGELLYQSDDKFATRHTIFILWGESDDVWVYSGDVGTFYWTKEGDSWKKQDDTPYENAPDFLKEIRPKQHS